MVVVPYKYEVLGKKNLNTLIIKLENGDILEVKQLATIPENHKFFDTTDMNYVEFPSDLKKLREYALYVMKDAPELYREVNLLEQQVAELIKNAIRHGNLMDPSKKVKVWWHFKGYAKVIVEDEGEGFQDIENWNKFNLARTIAIYTQDLERVMDYISWRGKTSTEMDGGNALFAALEYWNVALAFSSKGNKVVAIKYFPDHPEYNKYV